MGEFWSGAVSLFWVTVNGWTGYSLAIAVFGFSDASPRKRVICTLGLVVVGLMLSVSLFLGFLGGGFSGVLGRKEIWVVIGVLVAAARAVGVAAKLGRGLAVPGVVLLVLAGLVVGVGDSGRESEKLAKIKTEPVVISVDAPVSLVAPMPAQVVESCECASGAVCTGPRGGRYCMTPAGSKKYL